MKSGGKFFLVSISGTTWYYVRIDLGNNGIASQCTFGGNFVGRARGL